ncbi:hypothetical protein AVEN_53487-1 [Araneus ventricosus]|uniref:Secreted protein n=1 Tax=Araneus ventricosus TaxID=182803 RepID=A0A4Y2AAN4_ARAVE|nr:hypothetical protein AVEN_53487-1 [Araneus ventricosus]
MALSSPTARYGSLFSNCPLWLLLLQLPSMAPSSPAVLYDFLQARSKPPRKTSLLCGHGAVPLLFMSSMTRCSPTALYGSFFSNCPL